MKPRRVLELGIAAVGLCVVALILSVEQRGTGRSDWVVQISRFPKCQGQILCDVHSSLGDYLKEQNVTGDVVESHLELTMKLRTEFISSMIRHEEHPDVDSVELNLKCRDVEENVRDLGRYRLKKIGKTGRTVRCDLVEIP